MTLVCVERERLIATTYKRVVASHKFARPMSLPCLLTKAPFTRT